MAEAGVMTTLRRSGDERPRRRHHITSYPRAFIRTAWGPSFNVDEWLGHERRHPPTACSGTTIHLTTATRKRRMKWSGVWVGAAGTTASSCEQRGNTSRNRAPFS
ncbi:unnamed protein product [Gadus morhua 'NCC']